MCPAQYRVVPWKSDSSEHRFCLSYAVGGLGEESGYSAANFPVAIGLGGEMAGIRYTGKDITMHG
jgi:hypothetical protein